MASLTHRQGGALMPVLLIASVLLFLTSMLPQVLVSASQAMRNDDARQALLDAAESGVAFAEARLKRQIGDDLLAGVPVRTVPWIARPTFGNPDFGPRRPVTFETRMERLAPKDVMVTPTQILYRFTYRLASRAVDRKERSLRVAVSGLVTVGVRLEGGRGGMVIRSLGDTSLQAMNREIRE